MESSGYAFVLTCIDVAAHVPFELAPKHWLQKADDQQIQTIKAHLTQLNGIPIPLPSPYDHDVFLIPSETHKGSTHQYKPLSRDRWRYWIVAFEGSNDALPDLESACSLVENDIELGFHYVFVKGTTDALVWHQPSLQSFFNESDFYSLPPKILTDTDLRGIADAHQRIKSLDGSHEHVARAFRKFNDLRSLPRDSELVVIGLFSILESLVTHAPKLTDSADSLGHQIRTKMFLLRKRFARQINHSSQFGDISEDALWNKLYGYRSKIVHGEDAALDGGLKVLDDRKKVIGYLKETVKLLLLLSLTEPDLMTDLKRC